MRSVTHAGLVLCFAFVVAVGRVYAESTVRVNSRDELQQALRNARPGDKILMAPGVYRGGLSQAGLRGAKGRPIVLAALDPKRPPVIEGGTTCLQLTDPSYVDLRNLVLRKATGNGLNIDDGGSYSSPAHHIELHNLQISDIGPNGNRDGIKLSGVDNFVVRDCTLNRWGNGGSAIDMVGCHDGIIIDCSFSHVVTNSASGVQSKGGSRNIIVQRCRFETAGARAVNIGGSTGLDYFRPKPPKYEAKDIIVEDCTFIGSSSPIAFVGVDGAIVRRNTIYRPTRWVARILQESRGAQFTPCRNGQFIGNLVAFRSDEVRTTVNVGGGTEASSFTFSGNYWYCFDNPRRSDRINLPVKETRGRYGQDPEFVDAERGDLRLKSSSPVKDAGVRKTTRNQ